MGARSSLGKKYCDNAATMTIVKRQNLAAVMRFVKARATAYDGRKNLTGEN